MPEFYPGIDVGFSKRKSTTGTCLITVDQNRLQWQCNNTGTEDAKRRDDLQELVPMDATLTAVGIDGPLASGLNIVGCYRAADALLTKGGFQKRCKPGPTNSPTGQCLHRHATKLAELVLGLQEANPLDDASHCDRVHKKRIVEAFPNAFLAFLLSEQEASCKTPRGKKSDKFWDIAVDKGYLNNLIMHLAPGIHVDPLDSITNHDHRAAFICALTAVCVAKNKYVSVGDPKCGNIVLPPREVWGCGSNGGAGWAETTLRANVTAVRENNSKHQDHKNARVIRNGHRWM